MITRATLSTIEQGLPKYRSMLAGNTAYSPGAYESIATITVSSPTANINFTSIPQTYRHLQLRGITKDTYTPAAEANFLLFLFNGDSGNNMSMHYLRGRGSGFVSAGAATTTDNVDQIYAVSSGSGETNMFGCFIVDFLNYSDTNMYKTVRGYSFAVNNTSTTQARANTFSGNWRNTSGITSFRIASGWNTIAQFSSFALYGIKDS